MSWIREPNAEPISGYRLIEPIGSGGFGEVWKCEAPGGLYKAIKFVYGNLKSDDIDGVRAEQENRALQRIREVRHAYILSLERIEEVGGELIIVMELADKSLHDVFVEYQATGSRGIPRDKLLRYMQEAAEALDWLNEKYNLQHLDVKPRNLFVVSDHVKVADFGLVKHLGGQSGIQSGVTPLYAPPETFNGKISPHSDQYSLAIVFQELLTGMRPYTGKNVRQLALQHLQGEPDLRSLSEAERPVVSRALAKEPENRYPSCVAFVRALRKAVIAMRQEAIKTAEQIILPPHKPATMAEIAVAPPAAVHASDEELDLGGPAVVAGDPASAVLKELDAVGGLLGTAEELGGTVSGINKALDELPIEVSQLGVTIAQPTSGALRPTLIIGLGSVGRKALLELRCRFLDRFGDLNKLPVLRFLCLDPDPEALRVGVQGAPEVAFTRSEMQHLPLQPVGNYRNKRMLDHLNEWLPREKLHAMSRSLQTQGSRALGRLAFSDNHQRLVARLRREIQDITDPDAVFKSVTESGLALRDKTPRVYVICAAGGGSSGMLADLGYTIRRLLMQMKFVHPDVTALLMCGAPNDPATPKPELANVYATLTELNHFSDVSIPFCSQYSVEGQRQVDQGKPYTSIYLLPLEHRNPDALSDSVAHLGSYLFHELTTPLGMRLDHLRHEEQNVGPAFFATPFRSFGTYSVWFPRGLMLRIAARKSLQRLLEEWHQANEDQTRPVLGEVTAVVDEIASDPELAPEALSARLEKLARFERAGEAGGTPQESLERLLLSVEDQAQQALAADDPAAFARSAFHRVRDWVGSGVDATKDATEWRKNRLQRILTAAAQKLAEEWEKDLARRIFTVMNLPGQRVSAAEAALLQVQLFTSTCYQDLKDQLAPLAAQSAQALARVEAAIAECQASNGFRLFGGRSPRRLVAGFRDQLTLFARLRLAEELHAAVASFFAALHGKLSDQLRDLGLIRQRLRHLQESLESPPSDTEEMAITKTSDLTVSRSPIATADESFWEAIHQTETARVVLPEGGEDLSGSAMKFLRQLAPEMWNQLDQELQESVLAPLGGLHKACMQSGDLMRSLAAPLMEQTTRFLGEQLPIMDVAQILASELTETSHDETFDAQTKLHLKKASPVVPGAKAKHHHTFLLIPASEHGKMLGEETVKKFPEIKVVKVSGQSDLMFCREQGVLGAEDLQKLLGPCRKVYEALVTAPATSPHARFDLHDWLPLDP
jgi:hypothetical protein